MKRGIKCDVKWRNSTQCQPPTNLRSIPQCLTIKLAHTAMPSRHPAPLSFKTPTEYFSALVGCHPNLLTVTKESFALCSILLLINHHLFIESILNPGSQVISMAKEVCHSLGLIYNPEVKLSLQSTNGEIDKMLGLVWSIPIQIGKITLYLQFHIMRNPTYDILLGRPFDVLAESIICNFKNESQTVTIHDLNTGKTATVLTFMHGTHPHTCCPSLDFCDLRIWSTIKEMLH